MRMPIGSHSLEELDRLALGQLHDRLLPRRLAADEAPDAARLARRARRADAEHADPEELLDRAPDLVLVRARIDGEGDEVLLLAADVALLGHERALDHVVQVHARSSPCASSRRRSTASSAASVITRWRCRSTSSTLSPSARITPTPGRLRADASTFGSGASMTSSAPPSATPSPVRIAAIFLVLNSSSASAPGARRAASRRRGDAAERSAAPRTFCGRENP